MKEPQQSLEEALFEMVVQKPTADERTAFLDGVCRDNPTLRARLDLLLEGYFGGAGFLQATEPEVETVPSPPAESPTQMIGRYKLLEKIGEGGFGEVWMAEQREPVKRRVALKIIKLGMDSRQVVARFEAERQALALMDHPNIAKIFDAGTTESPLTPPLFPSGGKDARRALEGVSAGRPYFVMELVGGIKITDYCDQNQLPTHERLKLFILVCQAIQHAHQKGIIHRDIKPSNILVTSHDGMPVPKVIDFGIAKATQQELTDKTVFTQFQQFIGTPAYISPEQAEMSALDIDTRADIYSLGVLLYELLVGQTPFDAKEMMKGGLDSLRQIIREKEPTKPSTKLKNLPASELTTTAQRRRAKALELTHLLRGDLDWIVMKCLEKNRTRRYETANGLARDIQRYLGKEPILARPPSTAYKIQKAWQRNKLVFSAGGLVGLALLLGIFASMWQAVRAKRAEQLARKNEATAQTEAARANEQKRLAEQNLTKAETAQNDATQQRNRADREAEVARQNLYYAQMHLGQQAWREHIGLPRLRELLTNWVPQAPSPDRRGWEWFYLNSLPYQNVRTLVEGATNMQPCALAWHDGSKRLAEATAEGLIRIWDVDRAETVLVLKGPAPGALWWGGKWVAWSPDGRKLASSGRNGTVHIWDTGSGQKLKILRGHKSWSSTVAFSSDGSRVAAWGADGGGTITIWDVKTGRVTAQVVHPSGVATGAWSPDDRFLASGHGDGTVTITGINPGDEVVTLRGHLETVYRLDWSHDGARLASTSGDNTARVWDVASRKTILGPLRHAHGITSVAWEPNGQRLATGGVDQTVKIWSATTGLESVVLRGHVQNVISLSWGVDGRLASGGGDGSVKIWNPIHDQESSELPGHEGRATAVSWKPDGKQLASGGDDGKIRIWDTATRKEVLVIHGHPGRVNPGFGLIRSLDWSPDGTHLASAGLDGAAKVWLMPSGQEVFALPADHQSVWSVAWSHDGTTVAAGSEDGTIRVVQDLKQNPKVHTFQAHGARSVGYRRGVRKLAWSPHGDRLASSGWWEPVVKLWDPIRGTELATMKDHRDSVLALAWSPDGKRLASGSIDQLAFIWDAETGQKLTTMRGHTYWVEGLAWSPDGSRIVSAGTDNSVRIWDPATGQETFVLRGNAGFFHDVAWNPDGAQLAAASSGGQIWIWDATPGFERETTPRPVLHGSKNILTQ